MAALSCLLATACADARPPRAPHQVSATLSPIHLAFPLLNGVLEQRVADHVGVAEELGAGSYAHARVGQLGARVYVYPWDRFNGVQFGAIVRTNLIVYPDRQSVTQDPSQLAEAGEFAYHDVQLTRANGRSSVFIGGSLGLKGVFSGYEYYTDRPFSPELRGLTVDFALVAGVAHMIGPSPWGSAPDAAVLGDAGMGLVEMRLGWTL